MSLTVERALQLKEGAKLEMYTPHDQKMNWTPIPLKFIRMVRDFVLVTEGIDKEALYTLPKKGVYPYVREVLG